MKTSNLNYVGSFSTLQTLGTKALVDYGTKYSPKQQELYYRLLKGLKIYEPEELYAMNSTKKLRISKAHTKAQQVLNLWKQEKMIEKSNNLYTPILEEAQSIVGLEVISKTKTKIPFTNRVSCRKIVKKPAFSLAGILSALSVDVEPDPEFLCTLSFDELNITKEDIVMKFKEHKLLPSNYDEL